MGVIGLSFYTKDLYLVITQKLTVKSVVVFMKTTMLFMKTATLFIKST